MRPDETSQRAIDEFARRLDDFYKAISECQSRLIPQSTSDLFGVGPAEQLQSYLDSVLRPRLDAKNAARQDVIDLIRDGLPLDDRLRELFSRDATFDAAFDYLALSATLSVGRALIYEIEIDGSGRRGEDALDTLLSPPIPMNLRRLDPVPRRARRLDGAFRMLRFLFDDPEQYSHRPRPYLGTVAAREAERVQRDEEIADRDHLGMVPKERSLGSDDERRAHRRRNREAVALDDDDRDDDDRDDVALAAGSLDAVEILIFLENEQEIIEGLAEFRGGLTVPLAQLFDLIHDGENPASACRKLGLPESAANTLRNRAKRFGNRLRKRDKIPRG